MNKTIDLYMISGFLGAGKTTFLQNILEDFNHQKVGIIVNEFGSIGIDGMLMNRNGILMVEINNGSIYCSCLKGGFIKTLLGFLKESIDVLFIENSGMADPSNIHNILGELSSDNGRSYLYKGAVCLIDPVTFLKHVKVLSPIKNQVLTSNFVVINKIDMVNKLTIDEVKSTIKELNPDAVIYETMYSKVPIKIFENNISDREFSKETSNQPYNRMITYSLECMENLDKDKFLQFVRVLQPKLLRMKGLVKVSNAWYRIDTVGESLEFRETTLNKKDVITHTKLVVISNESAAFLDFLEEKWKEICQVPLVVYE